MGRTEKSQGLAPPAIRKDMRAKQARHIVNKVIPGILASNARARKGAEGGELVVDPGIGYVQAARGEEMARKGKQARQEKDGAEARYIKRKGQGRRRVKGNSVSEDEEDDRPGKQPQKDGEQPPHPLKIRILPTDTLTAAHILLPPTPRSRAHRIPNPAILNMASPLRPGGGVLAGATSQEEFLCTRTTLLPSLKESFYRLPELGAVFTPDVLVFRNAGPLGDVRSEIPVKERWYVDVVSAGMLRFPDLETESGGGGGGEGEDEVKRLSRKDRRAVEAKMRAVLRVAVAKGVRKIVLGAWGCGAYGNPVGDVAEAWRAVLFPKSPVSTASHQVGKGRKVGGREVWEGLGLEEVVFAIGNAKMAGEFAGAFGGEVEVVAGGDEEEKEEEEEDEVAEELRAKIAEMEGQIEKVWNPELKERMSVILEGLRAQLREREGERADSDEEEGGSEIGDVDGGLFHDYGGLFDAETGGVDLSADEVEVVYYSSDEWQVSIFD